MSVGGIFILLAFVVFLLETIGMAVIPRIEALGLAFLSLGLLLWGWPIPPWPPRP